MELQGTIKRIEDTQSFKNDFKKRVLVLTTDDKYPQHIAIDFLQDKTSILDSFNQGEQVKIGINIRGKEWIGGEGVTKYFNSIVGWRIEKLPEDKNSAPPAPEPNFDIDLEKDEDEEDFPF
jgi:hypothetical protein